MPALFEDERKKRNSINIIVFTHVFLCVFCVYCIVHTDIFYFPFFLKEKTQVDQSIISRLLVGWFVLYCTIPLLSKPLSLSLT